MTHPETRRLITAVEELTGYRVSIDTIDGIHEGARVISARPGSPFRKHPICNPEIDSIALVIRRRAK